MQNDGIWLKFKKGSHSENLKPSEALEEALCFGWIDGVMKKIDDQYYIKYFSQRRNNSKWSEKNKELALSLEKQGLLTVYGKKEIEKAKKDGQWTKNSKTPEATKEQFEQLLELLKTNKVAHDNFINMSASVKRTYAKGYYAAKTEKGREKRLEWMIERLEKNLKPM